MSFSYSNMDQLILQRWPDVVGLIEAQRGVQDRIEEMIDVVGELVARWARPLGFETSVTSREPEFHAWRPNWSDKRRGPKAVLVLGGFCPLGFRKMDAKYPYQWVNIDNLANFKVKDAERVAFSNALRSALGDQAKSWEADGVDDTECPLGRYLTGVSNTDRAQLVSTPEALFAFVIEQYPPLFELADVIDAELQKLVR